MLEIIRKSTFSNDFIAKENGVVVAELDRATWSQTARNALLTSRNAVSCYRSFL